MALERWERHQRLKLRGNAGVFIPENSGWQVGPGPLCRDFPFEDARGGFNNILRSIHDDDRVSEAVLSRAEDAMGEGLGDGGESRGGGRF